MDLVYESSPGVLDLNWMWLPTWLGQNAVVTKQLEDHVKAWIKGQPSLEVTEDNIRAIEAVALNFIREKFPEVHGLVEYLEGLKNVRIGPEG